MSKKEKKKGFKFKGEIVPKGLKKSLPKYSGSKVISKYTRESSGKLVTPGKTGYIDQEMIKERVGWLS